MTYSTISSAGGDSSQERSARRVTVLDFARRKEAGEPIVMITGYDALFASLIDAAGVDAILVGDSVATVLGGEKTTLGATVDQMIYHGRPCCAGARVEPSSWWTCRS